MTKGRPGRVVPARSSPAPDGPLWISRARYQILGMRMARCASLATMAAPVEVRVPATAKELLPFTAAGRSIDEPAAGACEPGAEPLNGGSVLLAPSIGGKRRAPAGI